MNVINKPLTSYSNYHGSITAVDCSNFSLDDVQALASGKTNLSVS